MLPLLILCSIPTGSSGLLPTDNSFDLCGSMLGHQIAFHFPAVYTTVFEKHFHLKLRAIRDMRKMINYKKITFVSDGSPQFQMGG